MNYPNVTLQIKDELPSIVLNLDESSSRAMIVGVARLDDTIMAAAEKLGIDAKSAEDALSQAREADEQAIVIPLENYEDGGISFAQLNDFVQKQAESYAASDTESEEVNTQVDSYWKLDMLASFIEAIYSTLVVKTTYAASEVGVGNIVLSDERKDARLLEKMSKELGAIEEISFSVL